MHMPSSLEVRPYGMSKMTEVCKDDGSWMVKSRPIIHSSVHNIFETFS